MPEPTITKLDLWSCVSPNGIRIFGWWEQSQGVADIRLRIKIIVGFLIKERIV